MQGSVEGLGALELPLVVVGVGGLFSALFGTGELATLLCRAGLLVVLCTAFTGVRFCSSQKLREISLKLFLPCLNCLLT